MTIRCPLEFEHAEEARAAKVGGYMARHYGCTAVIDHAPPKQAAPRVERECVECGEVKAWAGAHVRCPACRGARVKASTPRPAMRFITREELEAVLGGRRRTLTSRALGRSGEYLSGCVKRGKIPQDVWARLEELCR